MKKLKMSRGCGRHFTVPYSSGLVHQCVYHTTPEGDCFCPCGARQTQPETLSDNGEEKFRA